MTTGDQLLRGICLHPEDDGRRLVYADWLDENGQGERAEFIRVQCKMAEFGCRKNAQEGSDAPSYPCGMCDHCELGVVETRLKNALVIPLWHGEQPGEAVRIGAIHRRGFAETITCHCPEWLERGPSIVLQHPVTEVWLLEPLHTQYGSGLQRQMLADGIPVQLPQVKAALTWARRKAGLEVKCRECASGVVPTDRDDNTCEVCHGTGWRPADE